MTEFTTNQYAGLRRGRIEGIDLARGIALIAMASYHFTWDLEFFGYEPGGMTAVGGWKLYARCIASTFLLLAGVSLVLAHGDGIRWSGFWKRFAMVAGAAALISIATYFAVPDGFIFFGILHEIALASLLGLLFVRLPAVLTLLVAAGVIAAPFFLRAGIFNHDAMLWVGLSTATPRSNDYVPVFPWFGAVLTGIAVARLAADAGLFARLALIRPGAWSRPLRFAGRHSLAFYLIHQPVLIGCVWLVSQIYPPTPESRESRFMRSCENSCHESRDAPFCTQYCVCMLDTLTAQNVIEGVYANDPNPQLRTEVEGTARICTAQTDDAILHTAPD